VQRTAAGSFYARRGKRLLDIVGACLLLLSFSLLILVASIFVLLSSGLPVFYRSERMGLKGRRFHMWKLRTMVKDADKAFATWETTDPFLLATFKESYKLLEDPRITRVGRFLRRSSIDELPQLLNVLVGDMSLVGPRPVVYAEADRYGPAKDEILGSRPGLTGPWQIGGRNSLSNQERTHLSIEYLRNLSLVGDIKILLATLWAPFRYDGA
jgi:lipopolysaccharide/colanic/teichoic acid biosynthesis glycosyltransferase